MAPVSARRSPPEDKAEDYRRQRRARPHSNQATLRLGRRRRKAEINRGDRREARTRLAITTDHDDMVILKRSAWHRFHRPIPLGEYVARNAAARRRRAAWNLLKQYPYESDRDRARFAAFLRSLTETGGDEARELAAVWRERLAEGWHTHDWLEAFFADEPEWRDRLDGWIAANQA